MAALRTIDRKGISKTFDYGWGCACKHPILDQYQHLQGTGNLYRMSLAFPRYKELESMLMLRITFLRNLKTAIAFLIAYASTVSPRIATVLLALIRRRASRSWANEELLRCLRQGLQLNRFPVFCATIVGGTNALRDPLNWVFQACDAKIHGGESVRRTRNNRIAARFVAALLAAVAGFRLLNSSSQSSPTNGRARQDSDLSSDSVEVASSHNGRPKKQSRVPPGMPQLPVRAQTARRPVSTSGVPLSGKTMDLTLFIFVRAVDVLAQKNNASKAPKTRLIRWFSSRASPILFASASAIIMHTFFYAPSRLPSTYVKWIDQIAECDERLIEALRQAYYGNFVYGKDTGMAPLLGGMAKDYGMPEECGDPAKTVPVPCELVHHGCGPSCEKHALWRFWRACRLALGVYGPLQALVLARRLMKDPKAEKSALFKQSLMDTARSSSFLGAFVALFYYGVCLSRTRLGPNLFDPKTVSPQMWDSGYCVDGGCLLCGWSVCLEYPKRQAELMLFVVPRALGVWFPRRYLRENRWKEEAIFALSTATVLTAAQESPETVRGVFGRLLNQLMGT